MRYAFIIFIMKSIAKSQMKYDTQANTPFQIQKVEIF